MLVSISVSDWVINERAADSGIKIGGGRRSIRKIPTQIPLRPPHIPHDLGSNAGRRGGKRRLTDWATARPFVNNE
jgi:hypothetical protein